MFKDYEFENDIKFDSIFNFNDENLNNENFDIDEFFNEDLFKPCAQNIDNARDFKNVEDSDIIRDESCLNKFLKNFNIKHALKPTTCFCQVIVRSYGLSLSNLIPLLKLIYGINEYEVRFLSHICFSLKSISVNEHHVYFCAKNFNDYINNLICHKSILNIIKVKYQYTYFCSKCKYQNVEKCNYGAIICHEVCEYACPTLIRQAWICSRCALVNLSTNPLNNTSDNLVDNQLNNNLTNPINTNLTNPINNSLINSVNSGLNNKLNKRKNNPINNKSTNLDKNYLFNMINNTLTNPNNNEIFNPINNNLTNPIDNTLNNQINNEIFNPSNNRLTNLSNNNLTNPINNSFTNPIINEIFNALNNTSHNPINNKKHNPHNNKNTNPSNNKTTNLTNKNTNPTNNKNTNPTNSLKFNYSILETKIYPSKITTAFIVITLKGLKNIKVLINSRPDSDISVALNGHFEAKYIFVESRGIYNVFNLNNNKFYRLSSDGVGMQSFVNPPFRPEDVRVILWHHSRPFVVAKSLLSKNRFEYYKRNSKRKLSQCSGHVQNNVGENMADHAQNGLEGKENLDFAHFAKFLELDLDCNNKHKKI